MLLSNLDTNSAITVKVHLQACITLQELGQFPISPNLHPLSRPVLHDDILRFSGDDDFAMIHDCHTVS